MSIAKDFNAHHELEEEFSYHSEEAEYHLEQYLRSMEEVESHYAKYRQHSRSRDSYSKALKEVLHVAS